MWLTVCLVFGALWLLYRFLTNIYDYWDEKGVPNIRGTFPLGSSKDIILFRKYLGYAHEDIYKKLAPHRYGGFYLGRRPVLMLRDPEIIGSIMVKDFSHFRDRTRSAHHATDWISKHLFSVTHELWRPLRLKLTPTFTSGKLKYMFSHFQKCSTALDKALKQRADESTVIDIKELMARFTTDVICTCAFGLDIDSINNPENDFRKIGSKVFLPGVTIPQFCRLFITETFPFTRRFFKKSLIDQELKQFLTSVVRETVEYRTKNGITRNDFLDLLIELKNKSNIDAKSNNGETVYDTEKTLEMTLELMVAQCFVFFAAGFETSSSVLSYCLYELAINPGIQNKLRAEIEEVTEKHGGLTYDAIKEMVYLDQVISETIRKYPTLQYLNRTCSKDYRMPDSGALIDEGTLIVIPAYALHHDPKYFPDPEVFDPDRFLPERKSSIPNFAYLPFGEGPRNCIGMRFGKLQTKMGICTVLLKYEVQKTDKTPVPLPFVASFLVTSTKGPIYLQMKALNSV